MIGLATFAATDLNYLGKHNSNVASIEQSINRLQWAYLPKSQRNTSYGYAGVGPAGRVTDEQLAVGVQLRASKGQPDGYVPLDATGQVAAEYLPATTPVYYSVPPGDPRYPGYTQQEYLALQIVQTRYQRDAYNGYAGLDAGAQVAAGLLGGESISGGYIDRALLWSSADFRTSTRGGFPRIDAGTGRIADAWVNLPAMSGVLLRSGKGAANGYAGLDANGLVTASQIDITALRAALGI